jgi:hypothetical protein
MFNVAGVDGGGAPPPPPLPGGVGAPAAPLAPLGGPPAALAAGSADGGAHCGALRARGFPKFWTQDPEAWFHVAESLFRMHKITSQSSMYGYVLSEIPYEAMKDLKDILRNVPTTDPYDYLRAEVIARIAPNNEQKLRQLLSVEEMGDSTPWQFLRRLRELAGPAFPEDALRTIWIDRLPSTYPALLGALAGQAGVTLDVLGAMSDNIHTYVAGQRPVVSAVSVSAPPAAVVKAPSATDELLIAVRELTKRIGAIETELRGGERPSRTTFRNRSKTPGNRSVSRPLLGSGLCYYHDKFGDKAKLCTPGCKKAENK